MAAVPGSHGACAVEDLPVLLHRLKGLHARGAHGEVRYWCAGATALFFSSQERALVQAVSPSLSRCVTGMRRWSEYNQPDISWLL